MIEGLMLLVGCSGLLYYTFKFKDENEMQSKELENMRHYLLDKYQGQKLLIRYSPDLKKVYVLDSISKELEPIQLLDKNKNATMHRHKLKLSELGGQ